MEAEAHDIVQELCEQLGGNPVLLRIPPKTKRPASRGWQKIAWGMTQDPDYQEGLRSGNIGVAMGRQSRLEEDGAVYHLCTIDVDTDEAVAGFISLNPFLEETMQTAGARGCNFWLWVEEGDEVPGLKKLYFPKLDKEGRALAENDPKKPWGEWRNTGGQTVVHGIHPSGRLYRRLNPHRPKRIRFEELSWPEELNIPWRKGAFELLTEELGPPWIVSDKGKLYLNDPFFVGKYSVEHDVLWEPDEGRFYNYHGSRGLWMEKSADKIKWEFSKDLKAVADESGQQMLLTMRTPSFLGGLTNLLRGCVEKRDAFPREAGRIHLQNGMLDLREKPPKMFPFSKDFFSRNQLAVALDEGATCDRFMDELLRSALTEDDIDLLQRWSGMLLLGVNLAQKFMVLTGTAGGGKSTLINILARIIGQENVAALRTRFLHERFELFNYVGKTFLIGADVPGDFLMSDGAFVIKALVGKDILQAERKNGENVTIIGDFNIGITCNTRLRVRLDGDTEAWERRLMIVPYERAKPKKVDPNFVENLLESESSGILNWMIIGAMRVLEECDPGNGGRLLMSGRQVDRVHSLLSESDSLREFARHGVKTAAGHNVTSAELCGAYVSFCEERGWNPLPNRKVENSLPDVMLELHRVSRRNDIKRNDQSQRGYHGVRLVAQGNEGEAY